MSTQKIFHYLQELFLPVLLAGIFALQNQVFNQWLKLSNQYQGRLLFVSFALGLVLYGPALFFNKKGRYGYLFLISFFVSCLFIAQFVFFEYGQSFLQLSALKYIGQATSVWGTIATFISFKLIIFLVNMFVVVVAVFLVLKKPYLEIVLSKKEKIVLFVLLLAIAFCGYYFLVREEKKEWGSSSRLYKDVYDLNTLVQKVGIANFTLEDTVKYIARSNLVTPEDRNFLKNFASASAKASVDKAKYFGIDKNKNVIIVQVESLENAVINQTINGKEITPNLNALAGQGLYFSNYYTQVGPGNTADAEFSTLNSLYPLSDDVVFTDYAHNNFNALPKLLVANNYHTYALHGDVPTFWNRSNVYPNLGYQQQLSENDFVMSRPVGHGPSPLGDQDFLTQSVLKIKSFQQPFLATTITLSSHTPFELPADLQTLNIPKDTTLNYTQQQYLQSVHYADMAIGEFITGLKNAGLYNNSLIFIYGDHESFTNISQPFGTGDLPAQAGKNLPVLRDSQVPLIVLNSGIAPKEVVMPASHLDLYPTALNLLGIKPLQTVLGQDIFNTKTPVVTRRNIFSGTIAEILTDKLAFKSNEDGVFEDGTCFSPRSLGKVGLPIGDCKDLYNQQSDTVKASDIIVRGNLLNYLGSK